MASFGKARMKEEEEEVPPFLRNKNLYLSFHSKIVGIRIDDRLGKKEDPVIIEEGPEIFLNWDIHKAEGVPVGMGILVKDSKVYMIGGQHFHQQKCRSRLDCISISTLSKAVNEFAFRVGVGGGPTVLPCSSTEVTQLPVAMASPLIVKHLGETYLIHGGHFCQTCWHVPMSDSMLKTCFMILGKDGQWQFLPPPPRPPTFYFTFNGAIGSKLYLSDGRRSLFCYDIEKQEWEQRAPSNVFFTGEGSITLSSLSKKSSYVVITTEYTDVCHTIHAAMVDGDGIASNRQVLHQAKGHYDGMCTHKMIELVSNDDCSSSTFALLFSSHEAIMGLTVVRVSFLSGVKKVEENEAKRQRLYLENNFLKAEVLVNQRYEVDIFVPSMMNDAFFY
ncbi:hypothetical protein LINGRAHAP2_LOCUS35813 [Linum grandiflorum]